MEDKVERGSKDLSNRKPRLLFPRREGTQGWKQVIFIIIEILSTVIFLAFVWYLLGKGGS